LIPFVCLFGSNAIKEVAFRLGYGCLIPEDFNKERIPWTEICKIHDEQAFDLLNKMLELDHTKRISAADALNHSFFNQEPSHSKLDISINDEE
jgi:serine/threonine protein kinase